MPSFGQSLASSNSFRHFPHKNISCFANRDDLELFFASGGTLVAVDLTTKTHPYKMLDIGATYEIREIKLNPIKTLLALICLQHVIIVDLKDIPYSDPNASWQPLKFVVGGSDEDFLSATWHPANSTSTEIVVLTKLRIQSFDIFSFNHYKQFDKSLVELGIKDGATSIAFGSSSSLPGSLTLYVCTSSGHIHCIYPFLHKQRAIRATIASIDLFVAETQELVDSILPKYPPRVTAGHPSINDLLTQLNFATHLKEQASSLLWPSSNSQKFLCLKPMEIGSFTIGPLAQVPKGSKIILTESSESIIVAYNDTSSQFEIAYLAQFSPLIMTMTYDISRPEQANGKSNAMKKSDGSKYVRPNKGFGFVVDSDDEADTNDETQLQEYNKNWEFYELKIKCMKFILNFGKLTVLASEAYHKKLQNPLHIKAISNGRLVIGAGTTILLADYNEWLSKLRSDFPQGAEKFTCSKSIFTTDEAINAFDLIDDTIAGSGIHILAELVGGGVIVAPIHTHEHKKVHPRPKESMSSRFTPTTIREGGISCLDLKKLIPEMSNSPPKFTSNLRDASDLLALTKISDLMRSRVFQLSKFIVALNCKLEIQQQRNSFHGEKLSSFKVISNYITREAQYSSQIKNLKDRQMQLESRAKKAYLSIINRLEAIKQLRQMPLSNAEQSWFRELNELATKLKSTSEPEGFGTRLQAFVKQSKQLIETLKQSPPTDQLERSMYLLLLNNNVLNVGQHLLTQAQLIELVKERLRKSIESLQIVTGV